MSINSIIKGDKAIWAVVIMLSIVSTVVVYSSTGALAYKHQNGNTEFYLFKHVFTLVFGLALMVLTHNIKYIYYNRLSQIAMFAAIPLLAFTLLKGSNLNDASRWIQIPVINLSFQTSDFAKLALISYVARMLAIKQEKLNDFKTGFLPIILPVFAICGLIFPANLSTAAVLFTTCFALMFIGRVHYKHMLALIGLGVVALILVFGVSKVAPKLVPRMGTWTKRIENFGNQDSKGNFQAEQAKIAIATGAPFGKGPGKSTARNFLPQAYSDFIFAIILEEYGTIMGLGIILLYIIILFRGLRILKRCDKTFGSLLAFGLAFSLVFQGLINMAVATNLFPVTGQPLPLLSMGGTSIWFTSISIGIILSISRDLESEDANEIEEVENNKEVAIA